MQFNDQRMGLSIIREMGGRSSGTGRAIRWCETGGLAPWRYKPEGLRRGATNRFSNLVHERSLAAVMGAEPDANASRPIQSTAR